MATARAMTAGQFHSLVALVGRLHDEGERCAAARAWRAALVLLGAEAEAGLLAMVGALEPELRNDGHWGSGKQLLRWGLADLIQVARDAGWLKTELPGDVGLSDPTALLAGETGDAIDFVRQIRDAFAHPGRHMRELSFLDADDESVIRPTYELARLVVDATFADLVRVWDHYP